MSIDKERDARYLAPMQRKKEVIDQKVGAADTPQCVTRRSKD